MQQEGIFADPAQTSLYGPSFFKEGGRIYKGPGSKALALKVVGYDLEPQSQASVIVSPPGILGQGRPRLPSLKVALQHQENRLSALQEAGGVLAQRQGLGQVAHPSVVTPFNPGPIPLVSGVGRGMRVGLGKGMGRCYPPCIKA